MPFSCWQSLSLFPCLKVGKGFGFQSFCKKVGDQIGRLNIQGRVGRDIDLTLSDVNQLYEELPVELEGKFL